MIDQDTAQSNDFAARLPRQGANGTAEIATAEHKMTELPMVVWLRGDEDFVEQFSVDADEAMELLGIKRSRLTQISGKELRVGRMRQGRYVRPMFRECDILDYKNWTRPTASHKKSADAVDSAIDQLQDSLRLLNMTAKNLTSSVFQATAQSQSQIERHLQIEFLESKNNLNALVNNLCEQFKSLQNSYSSEQINTNDNHNQIMQSLVKLQQVFTPLAAQIQSLETSFDNKLILAEQFHQKTTQLLAGIQENSLTMIKSQQTHIARLENQFMELRQQITQLERNTKAAKNTQKPLSPFERRRRKNRRF